MRFLLNPETRTHRKLVKDAKPGEICQCTDGRIIIPVFNTDGNIVLISCIDDGVPLILNKSVTFHEELECYTYKLDSIIGG